MFFHPCADDLIPVVCGVRSAVVVLALRAIQPIYILGFAGLIIAFRSSFLKVFQELPQTSLERIESVDMMRAIEHGYRVRGVLTDHRLLGVDLPADIPRVEALLAEDDITGTYLNCAS